ncbi:hypothetical protein WA026_020764 [Henosepilachna vigintioctopunctata]|uniref:Uncharacterized protein n=1 Tax=Henosepilachna vigintioctopunctata TaxID=420089 RepID=A0AAW1TY45_9CUCU
MGEDDSIKKWTCSTVTNDPSLPATQKYSGGFVYKSDLLVLKQKIVNKISMSFNAKIGGVKQLLVSQNILIHNLISEVNRLKDHKNETKTITPWKTCMEHCWFYGAIIYR